MGQSVRHIGALRLVEVFPTVARLIDAEPVPLLAKFKTASSILPGNHVLKPVPRQETGDMGVIYDDGDAIAAEFEDTVRDMTRRSGAAKFEIAAPKTPTSFMRKSESDYDGDCSRVCDVRRASIYFSNAAQIGQFTRLVLPGNNSSVVRFEDTFSTPDPDGGLRRIHTNLRMSNGHIVEIQGRHLGMESAYNRSVVPYQRYRAFRGLIEQMENSGDEYSAVAYNIAQKEATRYGLQRARIHDVAARKYKMDDLIVDRSLYLVHGFPVAEIRDRKTGESSAIIPDFRTGLFVTDNRFLPLIGEESRGRNIQVNVSPDLFMKRCAPVITSERIRSALDQFAPAY